MLAANINGTVVSQGSEAIVSEWISDGTSYVIGFTGTGTYSGNFKLYVVSIDDSTATPTETKTGYYIYQTSPSNRTAYVVDRAFQVKKGDVVRLTVQHDSVDNQTFYGTILGGGN